jgi:hypothetical protein
MHVLGRLGAKRARQRGVKVRICEMVLAANDVRDAKVEVVHDRRELIGRASVRAQQRGASLLPETNSAVVLVGVGVFE